jgi:hypothetical protein
LSCDPADAICCLAGSCASGGEKPFFFNPDRVPADHAENLLWFHNYTTKADGKVAGNGANDGLIRTVTQGNKEAVKSMVLVDLKTNGEHLQSVTVPCCFLPAAVQMVDAVDWHRSVEATLRGQAGAPLHKRLYACASHDW